MVFFSKLWVAFFIMLLPWGCFSSPDRGGGYGVPRIPSFCPIVERAGQGGIDSQTLGWFFFLIGKAPVAPMVFSVSFLGVGAFVTMQILRAR